MQGSGVKSFVDDLALGRGIVPSRAVNTLRFNETKPFDWSFVRTRRSFTTESRRDLVFFSNFSQILVANLGKSLNSLRSIFVLKISNLRVRK